MVLVRPCTYTPAGYTNCWSITFKNKSICNNRLSITYLHPYSHPACSVSCSFQLLQNRFTSSFITSTGVTVNFLSTVQWKVMAWFTKSRALLPSLGRAGEARQSTLSPVPTEETQTPPTPHLRVQLGKTETSQFWSLLASCRIGAFSGFASAPVSGDIVFLQTLTIMLFHFPYSTHVPFPCLIYLFLPHGLAYALFAAHIWQTSGLLCEIPWLILSDRNAG